MVTLTGQIMHFDPLDCLLQILQLPLLAFCETSPKSRIMHTIKHGRKSCAVHPWTKEMMFYEANEIEYVEVSMYKKHTTT